MTMKALIFDCDGVLVDTERDGHRVAFNRAFEAKGLDTRWSVQRYGELLSTAGGKERMRRDFDENGWPDDVATDNQMDALIKKLHKLKTNLFMRIIEKGDLPLRPGVARVIDEAIADGMVLAVCSTASEQSVHTVVDTLLGKQRKAKFAAILAGDVVTHKKPDPQIYNLARQRLGLDAQHCVVIEDSRNGLLAAKAAGMHCLVTTSGYTAEEDFAEADAVVPELGDQPNVRVTLNDLKKLLGD